jgi:hypothetical protein
MRLGMTAVPPFAPVWDGLGLLTTALVSWIFITPCHPGSPSLYLPPFFVGIMLGLGKSRRSWPLYLSGALAYGLGLMVFAAAVIYFTDGPWTALLDAAWVIWLAMVPLAAVTLILTDRLITFVRRRSREE